MMKCVICRHGETKAGTVTVMLERAESTIVMKSVPAEICDNCGEQYIDEPTTTRLLAEADELAKSGAELEVRTFRAA